MKAINVTMVLSVLLFSGIQQAKAQANKHENKQDGKIKEIEHTESAPIKEAEVKTEPKETAKIAEHKETTPEKEQEVTTKTQPEANTPKKNSTATFSNILHNKASTKPIMVNRNNQTASTPSTNLPKK